MVLQPRCAPAVEKEAARGVEGELFVEPFVARQVAAARRFGLDGVGAEECRQRGVEFMGEPTRSAEAALGQRWVYFRSPWGMQFELVSFPAGKAYEAAAEVRLWHPAHPDQ